MYTLIRSEPFSGRQFHKHARNVYLHITNSDVHPLWMSLPVFTPFLTQLVPMVASVIQQGQCWTLKLRIRERQNFNDGGITSTVELVQKFLSAEC